MKKTILMLICIFHMSILSGCGNDYGNAGIYDLNGNMLVPYETIVKKYGFDVSKDYTSEQNTGFAKVLNKLGIEEEIVLVLPKVKKIGEHAFFFADNLAYIQLPDTLETIGCGAFYASGLQEINIPSGVIEISANTFDSCAELSSVVLSDGLKVIDTSAFRYTPNLNEISIPETVETIGSCAFQDAGMEYILIPETVQDIEDSAFENVETVCYNGKDETLNGFGAKKFHQYSNSNTCELCGGTVEYVPYTITEPLFIDEGVCDIPPIFEQNGVQYKNVMIGPKAYQNNEDIVSLKIPDTMVSICDEAFANCINLKQVELDDNIKYLGNFTFYNCISIEEIVIPDNVTNLYESFSGCNSLRDVYLPNKICIYVDDFDGCENLKNVFYSGTKEEWNEIPVGAPAPVMKSTIDIVFGDDVNIIYLE